MPSKVTAVLAPGKGEDLYATRARPRDLPELMDDCEDEDVLRGCLHDLAFANRITGSYRPTLRFLRRALLHTRGSRRRLRIVDVGSGYGDMLRRVARWASRRRIAVDLIGADLNPLATRIAAENTAHVHPHNPPIAWLTGDVTQRNDLAPDLVVSSLVMHHLEDEEIVSMLRWMESSARLGWFINDLERQSFPARVWSVLARLLRWHRFLHHDGPVSFRRAFRTDDWQRLLRLSGIPEHAVHIEKTFPARLCLTRLK